MKKLIEYFIDRPMIVNLATIIIIMAGLLSLTQLQMESFPKVEFGVFTIRTDYFGSSSEDVEKLVTIPLERELKSVAGIKEMNAVSTEGSSIITIQVDPDVSEDEVYDDVREVITQVNDLPTDADPPKLKRASNKTRAIMKVNLRGAPYKKLKKTVRSLRDSIETIGAISSVNLSGYREDEMKVTMDIDKINALEVTYNEVVDSIKKRNLNLSLGKLEINQTETLIRTTNEIRTVKDLEELIIRSNLSGKIVRLKDVAKIELVPEKEVYRNRSNSRPAIFLDILAKESANIIDTSNAVKEHVAEFFKKHDTKGIEYGITDDMSYYVKRRLNILKENGLLGICLVFICLMFFLNFSTSVVTSLGAPLAFFTAFIFMGWLDISLNLISMFGLILVLGMLVDDSIIVAEQFYQHLENGLDRKSAAKKAALETMRPVTATVLTTCIAFGALFFMGGIMGKFLWPVPAVVIICLGASLIECFFILPSHLSDFSRPHKKEKGKWYKLLMKSYELGLMKILNFPKITVFSFIILLGISGFIAKNMRYELFPGDDVRIVFLNLTGKVGTPLDLTDEEGVKLIEKTIDKEVSDSELDQYRTIVGTLIGKKSSKTGSHYGSIILYLNPPDERERSTDEIITAINAKIKLKLPDKYNFTIEKVEGGPPKGKAVEIELLGDSLEELKSASKEAKEVLAKVKGVTSTEIDYEEGKEQFLIDVKYSELKRLGFDETRFAVLLRNIFSEDSITEIRRSDEDVDIKLYLNEKYYKDENVFKKIYLTNNQGKRIPLLKIARIRKVPGAFVIRRLDQKRIISVSASINKDLTTPVMAAESVKPKVAKILENYPDLRFELGGENEDTKESMGRLFKSFILALSCIYFVLVVMFTNLSQPLIVMSAIPLGLIGVIFSFLLFGKTLGFMAMMGVVGLVGVVVNDSIVLVNFINKNIKQMSDKKEAILKASLSRFRPVLLTTFTTVAGLLPVAHAPGGDPFLKPMAMAFAWGLLFATIITLGFVPAAYLAYLSFIRLFDRLISKVKLLL